MTRLRLLAPLVASLLVLGAEPLYAQEREPTGSRLLSLDGWTYEAIERLRTRGYLTNLNPLVQPYRRIDVAEGLVGLDPGEHGVPVAGWIRLLQDELADELARLRGEDAQGWGVQVFAGGTAADSRRRDALVPFRPGGELGEDWQAWPFGAAGFWVETSTLAVDVRVKNDDWLHSDDTGDPDGEDPGGKVLFKRTDNAYVSVALPWGNLWVGRYRKNWAPIGQRGLMLSDFATTYPQVGLEAWFGPFSLNFVMGELETQGDDISAIRLKRYVVANRLDFRSETFYASIGEASLFGGRNQSPLRFLNPVELIFFDHDAEPDDITGNLMLNGMFWWRVAEDLTTYGEFVADDVDVNVLIGTEDRDAEPTTYQASLGARWTGLSDYVELGVDYRVVSAWSYRTPLFQEEWAYLERGLGDPWTDYDRWTFRADLFPPVPGLRVAPVLQFQRMGEGERNDPFPPREIQVQQPSLFLGVKETTTRVALQGHYQPVRQFFVEWDVGYSSIDAAGHQAGVDATRISAVARVGLTFELGPGGLR